MQLNTSNVRCSNTVVLWNNNFNNVSFWLEPFLFWSNDFSTGNAVIICFNSELKSVLPTTWRYALYTLACVCCTLSALYWAVHHLSGCTITIVNWHGALQPQGQRSAHRWSPRCDWEMYCVTWLLIAPCLQLLAHTHAHTHTHPYHKYNHRLQKLRVCRRLQQALSEAS